MGSIKLLNTNRQSSVTVRSFDGEEVTLPANQKEAVPVDEKFGWMLPAGVRNMSRPKNTDLTADPDADSNTVDDKSDVVKEPEVKTTVPDSGTATPTATDKPPVTSTTQAKTADNAATSAGTAGNS